MRIDTVTYIRLRYKALNGTPLSGERRTMRGAYRKLSWWLIMDQLRRRRQLDGDLMAAEKLHGISCTCRWMDEGDPILGGCLLHDSKTGYFRRLSNRIVRWLEAGYIKPEVGE